MKISYHDGEAKIDLHICSALEVANFLPDKKTGAIRIFNRDPILNRDYRPLRPSGLWGRVFEYTFDDLVNLSADEMDRLSRSSEDKDLYYAFLSRSLAGKIVNEFGLVLPDIQSLMVHCTDGMSRSPAVAIALNEIFRLGYDSTRLMWEFSKYNEVVYSLILEEGRKLMGN